MYIHIYMDIYIYIYPESSQIATNTRVILFNGAGGQTLVYHSDVVNMHDTRCVSFTEPTTHGLAQADDPLIY